MRISIKQRTKKLFPSLIKYREAFNSIYFQYLQAFDKKKFGYRGSESQIIVPAHIANPQNVFMYDRTRIQGHSKIITFTGKFIMKKFSGAAPGLTVVTGNHTPTVGIPYFLLPLSRVNDKEQDVIVEEDVWLGANVTLLAGVTVGRGAVVGACTVVTKSVPPYAVVVGNPAKIIAAKFTLDEILKHESLIYPEEERYSREFITTIYNRFFSDKRTIGLSLTEQNKKKYDEFLQAYNHY